MIFKMKKGKAAGKSGILPELLLYGGGALWLRLLELIQDMWNQGRVVSDWKDALIVPIPKKGDLQQCDNCSQPYYAQLSCCANTISTHPLPLRKPH